MNSVRLLAIHAEGADAEAARKQSAIWQPIYKHVPRSETSQHARKNGKVNEKKKSDS